MSYLTKCFNWNLFAHILKTNWSAFLRKEIKIRLYAALQLVREVECYLAAVTTDQWSHIKLVQVTLTQQSALLSRAGAEAIWTNLFSGNHDDEDSNKAALVECWESCGLQTHKIFYIWGQRLRGPTGKYNKIVEMYKPGILVLFNYRGPQSHKR